MGGGDVAVLKVEFEAGPGILRVYRDGRKVYEVNVHPGGLCEDDLFQRILELVHEYVKGAIIV